MSKIVMFGDSITQGWDGARLVEHPLAYWIEQKLGISVTNLGHGSGCIVGTQAKDFMPAIQSVDLTQYDTCTIAYGINDFVDTDDAYSLEAIQNQLNSCLDAIYKQNPDIQVYGLLPLPIWYNVDNQNTAKNAGFTENELIDALTETYLLRGIDVLDWRLNPVITKDNYQQFLGDKVIHPTQAAYEILGNRVADWLTNPQTPLQIWQAAKYHMVAHKERQSWWGQWGGRLRFLISEDGLDWRQLPSVTNIEARDPDMLKLGDMYYVIYTASVWKTQDFIHFENMNWTWWNKTHAALWAPEFFKTATGEIKIIYSGSPLGTDLTHLSLFIADFDPITGPAEGTEQPLTGDLGSKAAMDPNLTYLNGQYHLFYGVFLKGTLSTIQYATADNFLGPYTVHQTNLQQVQGNEQLEAPELFIDGSQMKLFSDPYGIDEPDGPWQNFGRNGEAYSVINNSDMTNFGELNLLSHIDEQPLMIRHAGFMLDTKVMQPTLQPVTGWTTFNHLHQNARSISNFLKTVEQHLVKDNYTDGLGFEEIADGFAVKDDRSEYLWRKQSTQEVEENVNRAIDFFNGTRWYWLPDNVALTYVDLWIPSGLAFTKKYCSRLNDNISQVQDRLNKMAGIFEQRKIV